MKRPDNGISSNRNNLMKSFQIAVWAFGEPIIICHGNEAQQRITFIIFKSTMIHFAFVGIVSGDIIICHGAYSEGGRCGVEEIISNLSGVAWEKKEGRIGGPDTEEGNVGDWADAGEERNNEKLIYEDGITV